MRNDVSFNLFYQTVLRKSTKLDFSKESTLPTKRPKPNYSILQYLDGSESSAKSYSPASAQDYFRQIYHEALCCRDALRDLVPFVQFKKREKHPWRSVTFSNFTKSNTPQ